MDQSEIRPRTKSSPQRCRSAHRCLARASMRIRWSWGYGELAFRADGGVLAGASRRVAHNGLSAQNPQNSVSLADAAPVRWPRGRQRLQQHRDRAIGADHTGKLSLHPELECIRFPTTHRRYREAHRMTQAPGGHTGIGQLVQQLVPRGSCGEPRHSRWPGYANAGPQTPIPGRRARLARVMDRHWALAGASHAAMHA